MTSTLSQKLLGKRALVTAGGQGIGRAIVTQLLSHGCHVAFHYFSSQQNADILLEEAAAPQGTRCAGFCADLRQPQNAQALVKQCTDFLGGLDVLINNAGSLIGRRSLPELEATFWSDTFSLNVDSMAWVTQAALPTLASNESASIVNLSSLAGRKGGHPGSLAYSTAKGAILTWTRALASELGPQGIRVNAVSPGLILGTSFHNTHSTKESIQATIEDIPLKRGGTPEDVARVVCFLASEHDGFMHGATLDINGGCYCA